MQHADRRVRSSVSRFPSSGQLFVAAKDAIPAPQVFHSFMRRHARASKPAVPAAASEGAHAGRMTPFRT